MKINNLKHFNIYMIHKNNVIFIFMDSTKLFKGFNC